MSHEISTCALTKLPIKNGDKVIHLTLQSNDPSHRTALNRANHYYSHLLSPVIGTYNGSFDITPDDPKDEAFAISLLDTEADISGMESIVDIISRDDVNYSQCFIHYDIAIELLKKMSMETKYEHVSNNISSVVNMICEDLSKLKSQCSAEEKEHIRAMKVFHSVSMIEGNGLFHNCHFFINGGIGKAIYSNIFASPNPNWKAANNALHKNIIANDKRASRSILRNMVLASYLDVLMSRVDNSWLPNRRYNASHRDDVIKLYHEHIFNNLFNKDEIEKEEKEPSKA